MMGRHFPTAQLPRDMPRAALPRPDAALIRRDMHARALSRVPTLRQTLSRVPTLRHNLSLVPTLRCAMSFVALLLWLMPLPAVAQGLASLVADRVTVTADEVLIAQGNVEVLYDGSRMTATRIVFDRRADMLTIEGPIFIRTPEGTTLVAERAELDPRLENGLLRGARLVLDQQLQLAANRIDRVGGRYSQLGQVAATSCQVCGTAAPLWEIRAARVVHDAEERQLYFENATFRIRGLPVFWVPMMRLPDPTLDRATGLLVPQIRTTDRLELGVKLPYFIRIGDRRDLTLTPYLSPRTRTLEARYRQAHANGGFQIDGAISQDDIRPETRSYVFADGSFHFGTDLVLDFGIEAVTDPAYLLEYGYSDADRLQNDVALRRVRRDDLMQATVIQFQTLRPGEAGGSLPPLVTAFEYERRLTPAGLGGTLTLDAGAEAFWRTADGSGDAARDVARIGGGADWRRDWLLGNGMLAELRGTLGVDYVVVADDPAFADSALRATPAMMAVLRWPLVQSRGTGNPGGDGPGSGAISYVEPVVALAWSGSHGDPLPNEDSTQVEFDEGNLFALDRFPGEDAVETGLRGTLGVSWTRIGNSGNASTLTLGRILRDRGEQGFSDATGLAGTASDWLLAGQIDLPGGLAINARTVFDNDFAFNKTGGRIGWTTDRLDLAATYVWLPSDPVAGAAEPVSEWTVDTSYRIDDRWAVSFDTRYNAVTEQVQRTGIGAGWRNECVTVDLSVSRRYSSSDTVPPSTDFGLSVGLSGFSTGRSGAAAPARCDG